jgi:hypothetical protein
MGFTAEPPAPDALPPETLGRDSSRREAQGFQTLGQESSQRDAQGFQTPGAESSQREAQGFTGSGEYGADAAGAGDVGEENRPNNLRDQIFDIVRPTGWTEELPEPPGSIPGHSLIQSSS